MFGTFEAVAVAFVALVPGATYVWSVERQVGRWGVGLPDTLLRYLSASAVLHFFLAPLSFVLWRDHLVGSTVIAKPFPTAAWLAAGLYLAIPIGAGTLVGRGVHYRWRWITRLAALRPPKAWDHLFGPNPSGWMKIKLKSGGWLGGLYGPFGGRHSYAAGHPHASDLYLASSIEVDQRSGAFVVDKDGRPHEFGPGILIRWDEVEYLKFFEEPA